MTDAWICVRHLVRWCAIVAFASATCTAYAEGRLFKVSTRPDVETTLFWEEKEGARATVFMFTGGGGGFGKVENGKPTSHNFLARTESMFIDNGFNVAVFGKPSDTEALDYDDRISSNHLADIRAVLAFVKAKSAAPIWIVGTSRGTISATFMAINTVDDPGIAGLVLTSSVVSFKKKGAVPSQDLAAIRIPVLVFHHANDACGVCKPYEVANIMRGLKNAVVKKQIMVEGGSGASGEPCESYHYHGFIGMEKEAVDTIAAWIRNPTN